MDNRIFSVKKRPMKSLLNSPLQLPSRSSLSSSFTPKISADILSTYQAIDYSTNATFPLMVSPLTDKALLDKKVAWVAGDDNDRKKYSNNVTSMNNHTPAKECRKNQTLKISALLDNLEEFTGTPNKVKIGKSYFILPQTTGYTPKKSNPMSRVSMLNEKDMFDAAFQDEKNINLNGMKTPAFLKSGKSMVALTELTPRVSQTSKSSDCIDSSSINVTCENSKHNKENQHFQSNKPISPIKSSSTPEKRQSNSTLHILTSASKSVRISISGKPITPPQSTGSKSISSSVSKSTSSIPRFASPKSTSSAIKLASEVSKSIDFTSPRATATSLRRASMSLNLSSPIGNSRNSLVPTSLRSPSAIPTAWNSSSKAKELPSMKFSPNRSLNVSTQVSTKFSESKRISLVRRQSLLQSPPNKRARIDNTPKKYLANGSSPSFKY